MPTKMRYIGTETASYPDHTSATLRFDVGPLVYDGPDVPPGDALTACNATYAPTRATLAFARFSVTVTSNSTFPAGITANVGSALAGNVGPHSILPVNGPDGPWACDEPIGGTFTAGQAMAFNGWLIFPALSPTNPTRAAANDIRSWMLTLAAIDQTNENSPTYSVTGTNAVTCTGMAGLDPQQTGLAIFQRPPYRWEYDNGGSVSCQAP